MFEKYIAKQKKKYKQFVLPHQINVIYGLDESLWFETNYFLLLSSSKGKSNLIWAVKRFETCASGYSIQVLVNTCAQYSQFFGYYVYTFPNKYIIVL